jgi:hypothetical protein
VNFDLRALRICAEFIVELIATSGKNGRTKYQ